MASVPRLVAAQPAPYTQPPVYTPPQTPPPQPGPPPGQPPPQQPPAQPYVPPEGQWEYVPPAPPPPRKVVKNVLPVLRIAPGAGFHFTRADSGLPSFDLDVTAGAALNLWSADRVTNDLAFEASYSFSSEPTIGGHFGAIGVTPMFHHDFLFGVGWAPKLVLGGTWQGFAAGMRNMLVFSGFADLVQLEAGHQWLHVEGQNQHEVRVLLAADLLRPLVLLAESLRGVGGL